MYDCPNFAKSMVAAQVIEAKYGVEVEFFTYFQT